MVSQQLAVVEFAVGHLPEHALEVGEGAVGGGEVAGEVLGEGEVDPVATDPGLDAEDLEARGGVALVVAEVGLEGGEVVEEGERVLEGLNR